MPSWVRLIPTRVVTTWVWAQFSVRGQRCAVDLPSMLSRPAPFTAFVASVAGPTAGHALSAGVILAIFNALIAQIMFSARLLFSFGRDNIFHPAVNSALAGVHVASGAPRAATWVMGAITAACCLLNTHALVVF